MKPSKLALFSVALWLTTAGVAAWLFVHGQTAPGTDGRKAVQLTPQERDLVLQEMRGLLQATHGVLEGLSKDDLPLVEKSARAGGMAAAADVNPMLMAKLPLEFKQLGMSVHQGMDDIARAAEHQEPKAAILQRMSDQLGSCVACHAAWQLPVSVTRAGMAQNTVK
ncbi:hypothetical protein GALL_343560 [mine drainage metagenome]|uniref:Cytochrome C n=1 Tax=mine drainage metagenome TaxID=410659 RepID=A0A1J5R6Q5_9ZZZZ